MRVMGRMQGKNQGKRKARMLEERRRGKRYSKVNKGETLRNERSSKG